MFRSLAAAPRPSTRAFVAFPAAIRAAALLAAGVLLAAPDAQARQEGPPTNACGLPVKDAAGQPVLYDPAAVAACAPLSGGVRADESAGLAPTGVTARWAYASFGNLIGVPGIAVDGGEIYVGSYYYTGYWYVLRYSREARAYEQVFVSRGLPGLIALGLADVRGDGAKEVVAVQDDGTVTLFDQRTRVEVASFNAGLTSLAGMTLRDMDGDGKAEILLVRRFSSNALLVLTGTGAVVWQTTAAGGSDVAVGNMDADPSLEIATTSGAVIDWDSRSVQWQRANGFGNNVETGDFDSDGKDEVVAYQGGFVWAFDVDTQLPKWSIPMFDVAALWLGNVDLDPGLELLVGDGQWGQVHAFDPVTQTQEWAIDNPEHGVTHIAVGDANGDGAREVLWGAGATSSGSDRLYVADAATHTIDWQNLQLDGPFLPPQRGDVDGDGVAEIVTVSTSSEADYDSGRIVVLDGATQRVRAISPTTFGNFAWTGVHDIRLRNVDADPQLEIVVAADWLYDGTIEIYDFTAPGTFTLKWTNSVRPEGAPFYSVEVADVDDDGALEVVGGVGMAHTGQQGTYVYVYSYPGGTEEWHTFTLTTSWYPINGLAVLKQGGGVADIVAMVDGETLNFFTGTGQVQAIVPGPFAFLGEDASSTGRSFLVGMDTGEVRQYQRQGSAYAVTWSRLLGAPVDGVSMLAGGRMAATLGGRLSLYPDRTAPVSWQSEDYGVRGSVLVGGGAAFRPFAGGSYALVSLAPWRTLMDVQPRSGPFVGGTQITATGTAFDPGALLYVGGKAASGVQVVGPAQVTGATPTLRPCSVSTVTVVNPDMSFELMEDAFTARRLGFGGCGPRPALPADAVDTEAAGARR